jgi:hypothetical protein
MHLPSKSFQLELWFKGSKAKLAAHSLFSIKVQDFHF